MWKISNKKKEMCSLIKRWIDWILSLILCCHIHPETGKNAHFWEFKLKYEQWVRDRDRYMSLYTTRRNKPISLSCLLQKGIQRKTEAFSRKAAKWEKPIMTHTRTHTLTHTDTQSGQYGADIRMINADVIQQLVSIEQYKWSNRCLKVLY